MALASLDALVRTRAKSRPGGIDSQTLEVAAGGSLRSPPSPPPRAHLHTSPRRRTSRRGSAPSRTGVLLYAPPVGGPRGPPLSPTSLPARLPPLLDSRRIGRCREGEQDVDEGDEGGEGGRDCGQAGAA